MKLSTKYRRLSVLLDVSLFAVAIIAGQLGRPVFALSVFGLATVLYFLGLFYILWNSRK